MKDNGFEQATQPTIYLMNAAHGIAKTQILFRAQGNALPAILATLGRQWQTINPRDGDNFNYHFLDESYGRLFARQEQLQAALTGFSALAVLIASLGVFALAAQSIRTRLKEVAIRKVFGAQHRQLLVTLGRPFLYLTLIANGLAWPIALFVSSTWLETFAYRVHLTPVPFVTALAVSLGLVILTVGGQILRAVGVNPADRLRQ